jgi:hypothetical protein
MPCARAALDEGPAFDPFRLSQRVMSQHKGDHCRNGGVVESTHARVCGGRSRSLAQVEHLNVNALRHRLSTCPRSGLTRTISTSSRDKYGPGAEALVSETAGVRSATSLRAWRGTRLQTWGRVCPLAKTLETSAPRLWANPGRRRPFVSSAGADRNGAGALLLSGSRATAEDPIKWQRKTWAGGCDTSKANTA